MMQKALFSLLFVFTTRSATAQLPVDSISETDVGRMLYYLASDSLKGRGNYTPELYTAACFIEQKFKEAGLTNALPAFRQPFTTKKVAPKKLLPDSAGRYDPKYILFNIVGMLPGKSKPEEIILFAAHYDHIATDGRRRKEGIYNGANDNASGTAALLALADYFSKRADNERTLMFCAFAGEELGLAGSAFFVQQFNTAVIKAVVNIEMIGRSDAVGKKAVFITGSEASDFAAIFKKAVQGRIQVRPEPGAEKQLYQRSDNYPFALQGVPAHTIMSSDDGDGCYHKPCDERERIDVTNMTVLIRAIAAGTRTLIDGTDTPAMNR